MKIIFCLNHFLPEKVAGIEVYTFNLALNLMKMGHEAVVLIPHLNGLETDSYVYDNVRVIRYAENSPDNTQIRKGLLEPSGLKNFVNVILAERPGIVHFQELAKGRGIGLFHLKALRGLGLKMVFTPHLSTYSCQTGNLVFKEQIICDGIIRVNRCTSCSYHSNGVTGIASGLLQSAAGALFATGINTNAWNSSLGTALGYPFLIAEKKRDLLLIADYCDKIISLTHWYKNILIRNKVAADKIVYSAQGLAGKPVRVGKLTVKPIRIVFAGRISRYKGVHLIIEALKQLPAGSITVDLYGQVTEDAYAAKCISESQKMEGVNWKGQVEPHAMIGIFAKYDLLCLPSTFSEMSPLVIQEAFAAGIPVVASNVYGNAEQIEDGVNGWLFDFKNVQSLVEKLIRLINKPSLIDLAKNKIQEPRSFETVAGEHLKVYQSILH